MPVSTKKLTRRKPFCGTRAVSGSGAAHLVAAARIVYAPGGSAMRVRAVGTRGRAAGDGAVAQEGEPQVASRPLARAAVGADGGQRHFRDPAVEPVRSMSALPVAAPHETAAASATSEPPSAARMRSSLRGADGQIRHDLLEH